MYAISGQIRRGLRLNRADSTDSWLACPLLIDFFLEGSTRGDRQTGLDAANRAEALNQQFRSWKECPEMSGFVRFSLKIDLT